MSGTLYLDFDGVLHSEGVILGPTGQPYLRSPEGGRLFENAQLLEELLEPYPLLRIVLSTSWVCSLGLDRAVSYLPSSLSARVVGSTYVPTSVGWGASSPPARGREVLADVRRREIAAWEWLAIDDTAEGWPEYVLDHLVLVRDQVQGMRHPETRAELVTKLKRFVR